MVTALVLGACGQVSVGPSTPNELPPSAPILTQGEFTSLNGKTVTGTAVIYRTDAENFILRLNGLSAPTENALQVVVVGNSGPIITFALRAFSGNQNYGFQATGSPLPKQVNIHSPIYNLDYGQAQMRYE